MSKPNMRADKNPMPTQDPKVRAHNFNEVATGYSEEAALDEANRCLNCKNMPCVSGCPVNVRIPSFIEKIKEGDFEGAYAVITETSSLPAVCGRVCPQETQCEQRCVRGIKGEPVGIGRLERYVADRHNENSKASPAAPEWNGHRVAVVGSGPSGLTCAGDLAKKGYKVTVFEALHTAGGVFIPGAGPPSGLRAEPRRAKGPASAAGIPPSGKARPPPTPEPRQGTVPTPRSARAAPAHCRSV